MKACHRPLISLLAKAYALSLLAGALLSPSLEAQACTTNYNPTTGTVTCSGPASCQMRTVPYLHCSNTIPCSNLFPYVHCVDVVSVDEVKVYFGAHNPGSEPIAAFVNKVTPATIPTFPPNLFQPGSRVYWAATVDPSSVPTITWQLDCEALDVDTQNIPDHFLSCDTQIGPPGPTGPPGPVGQPGPSGLENCRQVESPSATQTATVQCAVGEALVAGGGSCDNTLGLFPAIWEVGQIQSSAFVGTGAWQVQCRIGSATASATCCQVQ